MKPLMIAVLLALSLDPALAQSKRDIRGLSPGMVATQALAELKLMDCQVLPSTEQTSSPTCLFRKGNVYKNEALCVFLAGNLIDTPVWAVVLTFGSILNKEEISDAVARQFRVKMGLHDVANPDDDRTRIDLGDELSLRLAPERGTFIQGYRLSIWSRNLKAQDDKAEIENATPKF